MKYKTHNEIEIDINKTCLQGYINTDYSTLRTCFGEPHDADEYKSDAGWNICFENGKVASIYNWKNGHNYCGADGTPVTYITKWNIGGHEKQVVEMIQKVVES